MKNYLLSLTVLLLVLSFKGSADEKPIVLQGAVSVTFEDIDGYAQKIPSKDRSNFFYSVERIDKTVYTILNMKHVVKYGLDSKVINNETIEKIVLERMLNEYSEPIKSVPSIFVDKDYLQFKDYLMLEESYKFMLRYVKGSVNLQDLLVLAEEKYLVNKDSYLQKESRDISYFSILYNSANKKSIFLKTNELIKELENNNNFKEFKEKHKNENEISITTGLDKFKYNTEFKDFSDYVYSPSILGVIKHPLDAKNRYIVVFVKKITKQFYTPFEDVKDDILKSLAKDKSQRDFGELLLRLTQSPVEINQQALVDLKTRYLN